MTHGDGERAEAVAAGPEWYSDPADLLVQLLDALPDAPFRSGAVADWFDEPPFHELAERVAETAYSEGVVDEAEVTALLSDGGPREHLAVAVGLDEALRLLNPFSATVDAAGLEDVLHRFRTSGRLNDRTSGSLVFRRTYPGRPLSAKEKAEYFYTLRIPEAVGEPRCRHHSVAAAHDPLYRPGQPLRVAFVAMMDSYDDLDVTYRSTRGGPRYRLHPTARVEARLPEILSALDRSGADLAVLPEASLSDEIFAAWRRLFRANRPSGPTAPLRWILLGTGPVKGGANRAVLVDRWSGAELLVQDKLADFSISAYQLGAWKIPVRPPEPWDETTPVQEDISRDVQYTTLEGNLGRLGVLICESLTRWPATWGEEIVTSGTSHVLGPVLSRPIGPSTGWEVEATNQLVSLTGAAVMIANSLVVPAAEPASGERRAAPGFSFHVGEPEDARRHDYKAVQLFGRSTAAHEVPMIDRQHSNRWALERADRQGDDRPTVHAAEVRREWFPEREPACERRADGFASRRVDGLDRRSPGDRRRPAPEGLAGRPDAVPGELIDRRRGVDRRTAVARRTGLVDRRLG